MSYQAYLDNIKTKPATDPKISSAWSPKKGSLKMGRSNPT